MDKHRQRLKYATSTLTMSGSKRHKISISPEEDSQIKDYLRNYAIQQKNHTASKLLYQDKNVKSKAQKTNLRVSQLRNTNLTPSILNPHRLVSLKEARSE